MRLHRVRLSVGMLLFVVAVVAVNCWSFRHFYATDRYAGGMIGYRILPAGVGVLPLFNVTLIGSWLFATSQLRSLRRGPVNVPRSCLPGVGYFGLHFLLLGGLVSLLMPDAMQRAELVADTITDFAAEVWGAVFGEPGGSAPWVIFVSAILGGIISGPPLLLSWIAYVLTIRGAATLTRLRLRSSLVSLTFAGVATAVSLSPQPFEDEWEITLDFRVVDRDSGRPIGAAFVRIADPFSAFFDQELTPATPRALTTADGRARLTGRFKASGERNAFRTMGTFAPWGRWLEVSARGFQAARIPLTELLGPFEDLDRHPLRTVALAEGKTPEGQFRDIAGTYADAGTGFDGNGLQIEPDGRFAWLYWCCTGEAREYGYLSRHAGEEEIELIPIPHPGSETASGMPRRLRTIRWGSRIYLSSADDEELRSFCRAALASDRRASPKDRYCGYRRVSDSGKPQWGLPRLPLRVWIGFFLDELGSRTISALARR